MPQSCLPKQLSESKQLKLEKLATKFTFRGMRNLLPRNACSDLVRITLYIIIVDDLRAPVAIGSGEARSSLSRSSRAGRVLHLAAARGSLRAQCSVLFGSAKVNISISDLATLLW